MRVLMVSWEYPPVMVGGLGRHVHSLAESLARAGHAVTVLSRHREGVPYDEVLGGVRVVRVPEDPPLLPFDSELLAWTMGLNHALTRAGLAVVEDDPPDVVHAHDWLVAHAATTLKHHFGLPLVATLHATEAGRHQGWLPGPTNKAIHSVEWWLTYEARRVLTCSSYMRWEVTRLFDLPPDKVDVVPNGVVVDRWRPEPDRVAAIRRRYTSPTQPGAARATATHATVPHPRDPQDDAARPSTRPSRSSQAGQPSSAGPADPAGLAGAAAASPAAAASGSGAGPDGPLLVYAGRLVYEKGVQDLLRAMPRLRRRYPGIRLVVAGTGPHDGTLREQARRLRLGRSVCFTGFIGDDDLSALASAADCAVVPSIYEPFGLVALEAAAAGTPLVVADVGGLREFVDHGITGLRFAPGDVAGLADAVSALLSDQVLARRMARQSRTVLARDYAWSRVAELTVATYQRAQREERSLQAGLAARAAPRLVVRDGNLLTGGS